MQKCKLFILTILVILFFSAVRCEAFFWIGGGGSREKLFREFAFVTTNTSDNATAAARKLYIKPSSVSGNVTLTLTGSLTSGIHYMFLNQSSSGFSVVDPASKTFTIPSGGALFALIPVSNSELADFVCDSFYTTDYPNLLTMDSNYYYVGYNTAGTKSNIIKFVKPRTIDVVIADGGGGRVKTYSSLSTPANSTVSFTIGNGGASAQNGGSTSITISNNVLSDSVNGGNVGGNASCDGGGDGGSSSFNSTNYSGGNSSGDGGNGENGYSVWGIVTISSGGGGERLCSSGGCTSHGSTPSA